MAPRPLEEQVVEPLSPVPRLGGGDRQLGLELVVRQRIDTVIAVDERPSGPLIYVSHAPPYLPQLA